MKIVKDYLAGRMTTPVYRAGKVPTDAGYPRVTVQRIAGVPVGSFDGFSGLTDALVQVDVWAEDEDQAEAIATEVKDLMEDCRGVLVGGRKIQAAILTNEAEEPEPPTAGQSTGIERVSLDYDVWYEGR